MILYCLRLTEFHSWACETLQSVLLSSRARASRARARARVCVRRTAYRPYGVLTARRIKRYAQVQYSYNTTAIQEKNSCIAVIL